MTFILDQLARSGLLPKPDSAAILAGNNPLLSDLIQHLVILALDCEVLTRGDKNATWTQRRISRQLLGLTFMTALLLEGTLEPGKEDGAGTTAAVQERKL